MFTNQTEYGELTQLEQRANSGARWFYWIAALSLFTSIVTLSGSNWRFFLSLGTTRIITDIANRSEELGTAGKVIAFVFDLLATGIFVGLGVFAGKKYLWSYVVGMVLFGLDALILVLDQDWIGIVFHLLVLYWIFQGYSACRKFLALRPEIEQNQAGADTGLSEPAASAESA